MSEHPLSPTIGVVGWMFALQVTGVTGIRSLPHGRPLGESPGMRPDLTQRTVSLAVPVHRNHGRRRCVLHPTTTRTLLFVVCQPGGDFVPRGAGAPDICTARITLRSGRPGTSARTGAVFNNSEFRIWMHILYSKAHVSRRRLDAWLWMELRGSAGVFWR